MERVPWNDEKRPIILIFAGFGRVGAAVELVGNGSRISYARANCAAMYLNCREVGKHNMKPMRAWLSLEDFQRFWEYSSPAWAGKFLDEWTDRTMRTRLQPLMSVAEMLRRHKPLLLNWFRARGEFSAGCVEGMNGKAKLTMKKASGFKSYNVAEVALLHTLGKLPTPRVTHRFW